MCRQIVNATFLLNAMSLLLNPRFSRMIEGRVSRICPPDQEHINYSTNTTFYRRSTLQGYSLKFVLSGMEHYHINGQQRLIRNGQFLVVSHGSDVQVEIDGREPTHGVCVFLSTHQVNDVWHTLHNSTDTLLDTPERANIMPAFWEQVATARHTLLGQRMATLAGQLSAGQVDSPDLTGDLFYELATHLCQQQQVHNRNLTRLPAQKQATRDELYRRLLLAKEYMHDNVSEPSSLSDVAAVACLSEYHFLRSFKAVFGESPYQYVLRLRLQKAVDLLRFGSLPIGDVALACGFDEMQAFSKLFRKQQGVGPMRFRQLNRT